MIAARGEPRPTTQAPRGGHLCLPLGGCPKLSQVCLQSLGLSPQGEDVPGLSQARPLGLITRGFVYSGTSLCLLPPHHGLEGEPVPPVKYPSLIAIPGASQSHVGDTALPSKRGRFPDPAMAAGSTVPQEAGLLRTEGFSKEPVLPSEGGAPPLSPQGMGGLMLGALQDVQDPQGSVASSSRGYQRSQQGKGAGDGEVTLAIIACAQPLGNSDTAHHSMCPAFRDQWGPEGSWGSMCYPPVIIPHCVLYADFWDPQGCRYQLLPFSSLPVPEGLGPPKALQHGFQRDTLSLCLSKSHTSSCMRPLLTLQQTLRLSPLWP